mgnify:CR=1 FL=1
MSDAVLLLGDPRLRARCEPVEDPRDPAFREEARRLVQALLDFRAQHGFGRGIAAPQLGLLRRFIALRWGGQVEVLVNPEVEAWSPATFTLWDDCMCFPDRLVRVRRHLGLTLRWTTLEGESRRCEVRDPALAELLQHELDHLDGVLALDRAEGAVVLRAGADPVALRSQVDPYLRLRGPEEARTTPWRNGGGVTTELGIHPEEATVSDAFAWRVSTAQVATSGPFSAFPGYDRTLLLLEGDGMDLDFGAQGTAALREPLQPVAFDGGWETAGTLVGGPCRDFNVFTRRDTWRHTLQVVREPATLPDGELHLLAALGAPARLEPLGMPLEVGALAEVRGAIAIAPSGAVLAVTLTRP